MKKIFRDKSGEAKYSNKKNFDLATRFDLNLRRYVEKCSETVCHPLGWKFMPCAVGGLSLDSKQKCAKKVYAFSFVWIFFFLDLHIFYTYILVALKANFWCLGILSLRVDKAITR